MNAINATPTLLERLNTFLDRLPRTRFGCLGREVPAFRTCGITGFYVALIVLFGGGLLTGRSLLVLAALAMVSGLSFFAYTYLRKWITGREELVLLEHVWFAITCNALALWAMREPILPYLDLVSVALCPFLAAGRVGCTLVGCCHGNPSSFGITYNEACARDGFEQHLVGVRLFPAPALEGLGLVIIGALGFAMLPFAGPGKVFAWYLLAYSIMRFGLEGIRGDKRPHFLGLSQARWMSLAEFGVAVYLEGGIHTVRSIWIYAACCALLVVSLFYRWHNDARRCMLGPIHLCEARELLGGLLQHLPESPPASPQARTTSRSLTLAVSRAENGSPNMAHLSLSLPEGLSDLHLLCELAARMLPQPWGETAHFSESRVLHLLAQTGLSKRNYSRPLTKSGLENQANLAYGAVLRRLQAARDATNYSPIDLPLPAESGVGRFEPTSPPTNLQVGGPAAPWYFADVRQDLPEGLAFSISKD